MEDALRASRERLELVVDDNTDSAESLSMLIQLSGHRVRIAYGGASALQVARVFQPDLVFLEIGLPGKNGYQVAVELRALAEMRDSRLVAMAGYGQEEDRQRSRAAGFDHHLVKPNDFSEIERLLSPDPPRRWKKF